GRWRGEQQQPFTLVEGRSATARRRDRPADYRVPFPTGPEQVEQDRAPDVLPYHGELAWEALGQPSGGGELDREYHDQDGIADQRRTGHQLLQDRAQGDR